MKITAIFSGGMDSATMLALLASEHHDLVPIGFDYGQRHRKELDYAAKLCARFGWPYQVIDLSAVGQLLIGSSQTDRSVPVPHGHYAADNMKKTVVPNRNMVMLAVAGAIALANKSDAVAYGAHAGDHTIYPDCRPVFIRTMRTAFQLCDWETIDLLTPFQDWTKGQIAALGVMLEVPYDLTWTCYEGREQPCGLCGSCTERAEAFKFAGQPDPLVTR